MKFSTSALVAVAAFASKANAQEMMSVWPANIEQAAVIETFEGDGQNTGLRKLQLPLFPYPIVDDCDDDFSKYAFNINTGGTADVDEVMYTLELCDGPIEGSVGGGMGLFTGTPDLEICVPDGKNVILSVLGINSFSIAIQHVNKNGDGASASVEVFQNVHLDGFNGGIAATTDNTIGNENTYIEMYSADQLAMVVANAAAALAAQVPGLCTFFPSLCEQNFEVGGDAINPDSPVPGHAAVFTSRIGPNECGGDTAPDPHFKTFGGEWYDFHGGCDLVLLDVPDYDNQSGLTVDIRTTVRYAYSFIETLAIKVGEDILQVSSWGDYMINGISNAELEGATLNGLPVTREAITDKQFKFVVTLANGHHFTIKVFKDMISTHFDIPEEHSVLGLLGNSKGARVARDGITVIQDANEFGQEWQVQDLDHQLFATVREPQFPTKCIMPDPVEREQRRLSATVSQEAAEAACSHIKDEHVRDMCIFDVISVDDLSLAAGAY